MKRITESCLTNEESKPKIKGVADVVFVIDTSSDMIPFVYLFRDVINDFFEKMQKEDGIDARIGLIEQTGEIFIIKNFTKNTKEMKEAIDQFITRGNEFTLPAIDWAADFPWDTTGKAHRIIVIVTDEPLESGHNPDFQRSKMNELAQKLKELKINVLYFGYHCPEYKDFIENKIWGGIFVSVDFPFILSQKDKLMEIITLIRKVICNVALGSVRLSIAKVDKNIYSLPINGYPVIKYV